MSDYYPGLPYEANIIRDNESLGLPIYRIRELVFIQDQAPPVAGNALEEDKGRKRVDVQATIDSLIGLGAMIPNEEQATLESYMTRVEEILTRYEGYLQEWPFLVAQRLLKMQVSRLRSIKHALTEKLDNHPLSTANTAIFGSGQNQGNPPAGYDSMAYFGSAPAAADTYGTKHLQQVVTLLIGGTCFWAFGKILFDKHAFSGLGHNVISHNIIFLFLLKVNMTTTVS